MLTFINFLKRMPFFGNLVRYSEQNITNRRLRKKHNFIGKNARTIGAQVEDFCIISSKANINNSFFGRGSYICGGSVLQSCYIGRFCSLSNNICIISGRHPTHDFVSTNPIFYDTANRLPLGKGLAHFSEILHAKDNYSVVIGNDVWIGANVQIKEGVTIGDGAIIGMGSVVVKDVRPYEIVGGNPAKTIRFRFTDSQIAALLRIKWWNWPVEVIKERREAFSDLPSFISQFGTKQ